MKLKRRLYDQKLQNLFTGIAKTITASLHAPTIITAIMKQIDHFYHPSNWSLLLVDKKTGELYFAVAKGLDKKIMRKIRLKIGEGIAGHVAKSGKPLYIEDVQKDRRFSKKIDSISGFKTKSIIAVPIIYRKEVLGVIELINTINKKVFTKNEIAILEIIADFSSIALVNAAAYDYVTKLAESDPLTGIYNRKHLETLLANSRKKKITSTHTVIACIDLDYFKQVNDQYGHMIGDEVLKKTATQLQKRCRENDLLFRLGGDEFLIVIMNLKKTDVPTVIARLSNDIQMVAKQIKPAPGLSFGIASGSSNNLQNIIIEADKAMYQVKHKRSQTESASI